MLVVSDIKKVRCLINTVLIRPTRSNDEILLAGDKKLYIDTSFEPMKHAPTTGEVVGVPSQLYFSTKKNFHSSMDWDTDMELKVGDIATYHFLDIRVAIEQGDYILCDGKFYFPIRYDRIFCAKRKVPKGNIVIPENGNFVVDGKGRSEVIMLNGYVLVKPVPQEIITIMKLPQNVEGRHDARYGEVKFIGSPNKRYRESYPPDDNRLEIGMLVLLDKVCDIKLEYDIHTSFDGEKKYFRVQRNNITGFFNN
jgi:hypothetical protein